jgi:tetratricopeptide (TPR) repeat protein
MLRLQRRRSPRGWARRQRRLAEVFAQWRSEAEAGRDVEEVWADEEWRELRLAESYHLLCAGERAALPEVLRDFVRAAADGDVTAARWAQTLADAGRDAGARTAERWGGELTRALGESGTAAALGAVLRRAGLDERTQALGHAVQGSALRDAGAHEEALAAYDRAVALDPGLVRAYRSRAILHARQGDHDRAITDMDRALALSPDDARSHAARGEYHRILGHHDLALADLDHSIRLDPAHDFAWASRGATRLARGELDEALADLNQALELRPEYVWALVRRARTWRALGDPTRQLADLDRALALDPDWAWSRCERGDALRAAGRELAS